MKNVITCDSCDAEFKLSHSMDEDYYNITYCPFCGEEFNHEEEFYFSSEEED